MSDYEVFQLGDVVLQCGITLRGVEIVYKTYGELNASRDNAILMPTFFGGQHMNTEPMMAPGRALDPEEFFIIVPNMLGNGLSTSPSNAPPPFDRGGFPHVTLYDNVQCQHRLVTEHLGIERLRLVVGWSQGAQQVFQWGALHPDMVEALAPICGSARTSPHNYLLLDGAKEALTADPAFDGGWYEGSLAQGIRAFCRVYMSVVLSPEFLREREYRKLGLESPEDTMRFFEGFFRQRDPNDLLATLWTWQHAHIGENEIHEGNLDAALRAIRSRTIVLPAEGDLLFPVRDSELEVERMPNAELRPIRSAWGHLAGFGGNPSDNEFIDDALHELLAG